MEKVRGNLESDDITHLQFGYQVKKLKEGSLITQLAEVDLGSKLKNFLVEVFLARKIKKHMSEEVLRLAL